MTAGRVTERQSSADDVVKATGWVFNNETGDELTKARYQETEHVQAFYRTNRYYTGE